MSVLWSSFAPSLAVLKPCFGESVLSERLGWSPWAGCHQPLNAEVAFRCLAVLWAQSHEPVGLADFLQGLDIRRQGALRKTQEPSFALFLLTTRLLGGSSWDSCEPSPIITWLCHVLGSVMVKSQCDTAAVPLLGWTSRGRHPKVRFLHFFPSFLCHLIFLKN